MRFLLLALLALLAARPALGQTSPPNILLLFADDQRTDTIAAHGNPHIATPHQDALAARGTSFRNAYCLGSPHGAVCVPSRAMLHTGQPYFGVMKNGFEGRPTLGQLLGQAGYTTFGTGKWHNGRGTFLRSFQRGEAVFFGGMGDHHALRVVDTAGDRVTEPRVETTHSSELFANAAIRFLEQHGSRDGEGPDAPPFFCYVAFTAPHDPRDPPPAMRGPNALRRGLLPTAFRPQFPFDNGFLTVRDEHLAPWPRTPEVVSRQLDEYYALIEHMDAQVGRVLEALERTGAADNTLVVYAADHGLGMGSHGLMGKQSLFEHSTKAPMILAGPGVPRGQERHGLRYLFDLFPTLLERGGAAVPEDTFARSLEPALADPQGADPAAWETLFTSMGRSQRALRHGPWKLIRYPQAGRLQLFRLDVDPAEQRDLSGDPAHLNRITWMTQELARWQAAAGDDLDLLPSGPPTPEVDLSDHPRRPDRWQPKWIREAYFGE